MLSTESLIFRYVITMCIEEGESIDVLTLNYEMAEEILFDVMCQISQDLAIESIEYMDDLEHEEDF